MGAIVHECYCTWVLLYMGRKYYTWVALRSMHMIMLVQFMKGIFF